MKRNFSIVVMAFMVSLFLAGCASVQNGTTQPISFISQPEGADIFEKTMFGDKKIGTTPALLTLDKGIGKVLIFKKNGYKDKVVVMQSKVDSASYGNASNLMVGDAVDAFTGAKYKYKDSEVSVVMEAVK